MYSTQILDFQPLILDKEIVVGPTNKERLDEHDARLDRLEQVVEISPRPKKWRVKVREWIAANKATVIPVTAIAIGVLGWFASGWFKYYLDHRYDYIDEIITRNLSAKGGVKDTLASVQQTATRIDTTLTTLQPFIQDVIHHQFETASKLPIAAFREHLPAVQNLLSVARNQKVKIDAKIVNRMSEKLTEIPKRPLEYWQTVANLVSYRSFNSTSWTPQANLSDCTESKPSITTLVVTPNFDIPPPRPQQLKTNLGVYENCRITLDSPKDGDYLNSLLLENMAGINFHQCVVVYRGGPIKIILAWNQHVLDSTEAMELGASGNTLTFIDCLFEVSIQTPPTPQVQQFARTLLAQNTPTIKLPLAATH